jgi:23S rRNA (uracil1939-C5)-methyltransferase
MKKKRFKNTASSALISTTITTLSHDGRGIAAENNGKITFVSGALPGEDITFRISKAHKHFNEGYAVDILKASPERTLPVCPHFGVCGGCTLQHLQMDAQIAHKQNILLEQLWHFGRVEPQKVLAPLSAGSEGYRRKARLGVRFVEKKGKILVGFREKSSQVLADISDCAVLHPAVGKNFLEISQLLNSLDNRTEIAQIEVAMGDAAGALIFRHLVDLNHDDLEKLTAFGKKLNLHIYLQPNSPGTITKLWPADDNHRLQYALPDYGLDLQFHPQDFTQINGMVNPLMVKQALELLQLDASDTVLDLYCGLGNFTLPIARTAKQVTGIEGSLEMVNRARTNALANGISNTDFQVANLDLTPQAQPLWMQQQYTKILLDPARTGAQEIIKLFPQFAPRRIVYVSCNPATLARDAGTLVLKQGYTLTAVGAINMFPHTSHIEAMALFEMIK